MNMVDDTTTLTLNLRAVPGCWAAVNPDAPNREPVAAPPNGLAVVLLDPNNPPVLVLVPNAGKERHAETNTKRFRDE